MTDQNDSPTDEQEQDYVDESNEAIRRFLGDDSSAEADEAEAPPKEDVPAAQADAQADEPETKPEPTKAEDFDVEAETTKIKKDIVGRLSESFGLTDDESQEAEDEGIQAPWVKEKRTPKNYEEVAEYAAELAEFKREKQVKVEQERRQEAVKRQEKQNQNVNELWTMQLGELRDAGRIPKVDEGIQEKIDKGIPLNEQDAKDPGIQAQRALFNKMGTLAQERRAQGKPVITNLKEIYYEHYQSPKKQPAGADAPVSAGRPAAQEAEGDFKYEDIHNKSFYDIVNE